MKNHYPQTCYECEYCASWGHNSQKCDVCRRDRTPVEEFYKKIYQQVVQLPRCKREKLKRVPSYELGTRMLSALPFTSPDLQMQLSRDSVSELGDVVLAAVFSCGSTSDLVPEAEVQQDESEARCPTPAPSTAAVGTLTTLPDPSGATCSSSRIAAPLELLVEDANDKDGSTRSSGVTSVTVKPKNHRTDDVPVERLHVSEDFTDTD